MSERRFNPFNLPVRLSGIAKVLFTGPHPDGQRPIVLFRIRAAGLKFFFF